MARLPLTYFKANGLIWTIRFGSDRPILRKGILVVVPIHFALRLRVM